MNAPTHNFLIDFAARLAAGGDPFAHLDALHQKVGITASAYGFTVLCSDLARPDPAKSVFFRASAHTAPMGTAPRLSGDIPCVDPFLKQLQSQPQPIAQHFETLTLRPHPQTHQGDQPVQSDTCAGLVLPLSRGAHGVSGMGLWFAAPRTQGGAGDLWAQHGPALFTAAHLLDTYVRLEKPNTMVGLSQRELDCLHHLLAGHRAAEMCWKMGITEKTLEKHMTSIRAKLKAQTRDQALAKAIIMGLVRP